MTRIKDKLGDTAFDLLQPGDDELRKMMRKSQVGNSVAKGDIANDGEHHFTGAIPLEERAKVAHR